MNSTMIIEDFFYNYVVILHTPQLHTSMVYGLQLQADNFIDYLSVICSFLPLHTASLPLPSKQMVILELIP